MQVAHSFPADDGFVRLTLATLMDTPLVHSMSGLDDDFPDGEAKESAATTLSGYTEWLSDDQLITLGWDWHLVLTDRHPRCVRINDPRSNLMLVDTYRRDFGLHRTRQLLAGVIDSLAWQDDIVHFINHRYR